VIQDNHLLYVIGVLALIAAAKHFGYLDKAIAFLKGLFVKAPAAPGTTAPAPTFLAPAHAAAPLAHIDLTYLTANDLGTLPVPLLKEGLARASIIADTKALEASNLAMRAKLQELGPTLLQMVVAHAQAQPAATAAAPPTLSA
jgi:hypothetical protein